MKSKKAEEGISTLPGNRAREKDPPCQARQHARQWLPLKHVRSRACAQLRPGGAPRPGHVSHCPGHARRVRVGSPAAPHPELLLALEGLKKGVGAGGEGRWRKLLLCVVLS